MKLHDLRPAEGSRKARRRVGRGIAAGQGKTAGRGTKGQKARAGGNIPARFEGGQTPLHVRIPKLRGFKNRFKIEYEVVNLGAIAQLVEVGAFDAGDLPGTKKASKAAPITINQELLRAVGLVRTLNKPMKVLGTGDIGVALFVVADAFSKSAISKIEAAGGEVSILEIPTAPREALGVSKETTVRDDQSTPTTAEAPADALAGAADQDAGSADDAAPAKKAKPKAKGATADAAADAETVAATADAAPAKPAKPARPKAKRAATAKPADVADPADGAPATDDGPAAGTTPESADPAAEEPAATATSVDAAAPDAADPTEA